MRAQSLVIYAIQRETVGSFDHRFRIFSTKQERDETVTFLKNNLDPVKAKEIVPVILRVTVDPDENNQLTLGFSETG